MQQLVTHTSGYPTTVPRPYVDTCEMPLGLNPVSANLNQTLQQIRGVTP